MNTTTKRNLMEERQERENNVISLFKTAFFNKREPLTMQQFIDEQPEVEQIYTVSSLTSLFRKLIKNQVIKVAHLENAPTSVLISKQQFYHSEIIPERADRTWLTSEEKESLLANFKTQFTNEWDLIQNGIFIYVGCYETKEKNLQFISFLANIVYRKLEKPITSQEFAKILVGDMNEYYEKVIDSIREAKSRKYLRTVSPKDKVLDDYLFIPHDLEEVPLENRDWHYKHEARKIFMEQTKKDLQEIYDTEDNEKKVYKSLLNKGRLDVYLFMKIHRVLRIPKGLLLDIKLTDYDADNKILNILVDGDAFPVLIDVLTNSLIQEWLQIRSELPTANSDYFFITSKLPYLDRVNTLASVFRGEAKAQNYVMSLVYRDSINSFLRHKRFHLLDSDMKTEIKASKVEWFNRIEKNYFKSKQ